MQSEEHLNIPTRNNNESIHFIHKLTFAKTEYIREWMMDKNPNAKLNLS